MTADMLSAYYSRGCDSKELFKNYEISTVSSYEKNLNNYDVIHFDVQWCMMDAKYARTHRNVCPGRSCNFPQAGANSICELLALHKTKHPDCRFLLCRIGHFLFPVPVCSPQNVLVGAG